MKQDGNLTKLGSGSVVPLDSDDIDFYNFRFKGRKSEVDKLIRHLDEEKDCYSNLGDKGNDGE